MQVKDITRVRLTSGRTAKDQGNLTVGDRLFGQIVVDHQGVSSAIPEVLSDGRSGERGEILHGCRVGGGRAYDNRIVHGKRDEQFLADRFRGRQYLMRSYFMGATPANNYQPDMPYTVEVKTNAYTYQEEGYARFMITCGGADSPRPMTVRQKASTGEWFLWDYKGLLSGIQTPAADDPWS